MAIGCLSLAVVGCGGLKSPQMAPVEGTVTLDGNPVTDGYVFVTPAKGRMAKGEIQPDGSFVLGTFTDNDGALVGQHTVTVLPPPGTEGAPPKTGPGTIPARYGVVATSNLTANVEAGKTNQLTLLLSSAEE